MQAPTLAQSSPSVTAIPRSISRAANTGMAPGPRHRRYRTHVIAATNGSTRAAMETTASYGSSAQGLCARIDANCVLIANRAPNDTTAPAATTQVRRTASAITGAMACPSLISGSCRPGTGPGKMHVYPFQERHEIARHPRFSQSTSWRCSLAARSHALLDPRIDGEHEPGQLVDRVQGIQSCHPRLGQFALAERCPIGKRRDGPVAGLRPNPRAVGVDQHHLDRLHPARVGDDVPEDEQVAVGQPSPDASSTLAELRVCTGIRLEHPGTNGHIHGQATGARTVVGVTIDPPVAIQPV